MHSATPLPIAETLGMDVICSLFWFFGGKVVWLNASIPRSRKRRGVILPYLPSEEKGEEDVFA